MMQKRTIYSLLLISFILVFALSLSAQEVSLSVSGTVESFRCTESSLDIILDNPGSEDLSAVEVVFEITGADSAFFDPGSISVTWDENFSALTSRPTVKIESLGTDHIVVRMLAMKASAADATVAAGFNGVIAHLNYTTNKTCSGDIVIATGTYSCPTFDVSTQFVSTSNEFIEAAFVGATITLINQAPTINALDSVTIHWNDPDFTVSTGGSDPDGSCDKLTFDLTGPEGMEINTTSGVITWNQDGDDVGNHTVEVVVSDSCGASASTSFILCVTNDAPSMDACPVDTMLFALSDVVELSFSATDPDTGPKTLTYKLIDFVGPGNPSLLNGAFSWGTVYDDAYVGFWDVTVVVSDGANTDECSPRSADTCTIVVGVVNYLLTIETTECVIQGQAHTVDIYMQNSQLTNASMGGFDLLIQYDNSVLTFQYAEEGLFLSQCGWEYFQYRYGPNGNCGSACPTGEVRVVAIAETNDGAESNQKCFTNGPEISNQLVILSFLVTNDRNYECMMAPIKFVWYDCGDNALSSVDGNTLFISNHVYNSMDTSGGTFSEDLSAGNDDAFPTLNGANSTCDVVTGQTPDGIDKPTTMRFVDFVNGGICIICAEDIDDRGDLNMNGIAYEVADAVLYSRYFVYGLSVFTINIDGQIAASDVNADGLTLSVSDLVYLIRVVTGDANPYPKEVVPSNIKYTHQSDGTISLKSDMQIGAAHIVVAGDATPTLRANNMDMMYHFNGTNTNILVYSLDGQSFSGNILQVRGEIKSIDMADYDGIPVVAKWIPDNFGLNQNYPNPFNPSTTISFLLPKACSYELTIFNVQGQKIQSFSGTREAGEVSIQWDASNVASGIYFYRLNAENFSDTKKMVLLK